MRNITTSLLAAVLACLIVAESHGGGCRNIRSRVVSVVASRQFVVQSSVQFVPFAVPVAVPVAIVNTPSVVYGYSGYSAAYKNPKATMAQDQVAQESPDSLTAAEVITNRCVKCHGGDEPKAGMSLQDVSLDSLDRDTRYSMLRRIMEPDKRKRMPKGGELSREEFDALVNSLVR